MINFNNRFVPYKNLIKETAPNYGTNITKALIDDSKIMLGMLLLSQLGNNTLAASAYINGYKRLIETILGSSTISLTPKLASTSDNSQSLIGVLVRKAMLASTVYMGVTFLLTSYAEELFDLLQQPKELTQIAGNFFRIYRFQIPADGMLFVIGRFLENKNFLKEVISISAIRSLIELSITVLLVSNFISDIEMGVDGYGYATLLQSWIALIASLSYLLFKDKFVPFKLFQFTLQDPNSRISDNLKEILKNAAKSMLLGTAEVGALFASNLFMAFISKNALAAYHITAQYRSLITMSVNMFQKTISYASGVKQKQWANSYNAIATNNINPCYDIRRLTKLGVFFSLCLSMPALITYLSIPEALMKPFLDVNDPQNRQIVEITKSLFPWVGLGGIGIGIRASLNGTFIGAAQDITRPLVSGIIGILTALTVMGLTNIYDDSPIFIPIAQAIGIFVTVSMLFTFWSIRMQPDKIAIYFQEKEEKKISNNSSQEIDHRSSSENESSKNEESSFLLSPKNHFSFFKSFFSKTSSEEKKKSNFTEEMKNYGSIPTLGEIE